MNDKYEVKTKDSYSRRRRIREALIFHELLG
jgi:hypothetical protein